MSSNVVSIGDSSPTAETGFGYFPINCVIFKLYF